MSEDALTPNNLMKFRNKLGMSRAQTAEALRMSLDYYGKLERGERVPGSHYIGMFEATFGVPYKELYPVFYEVKPIEGQ